jgi:hypothetical protein
MKIRKMRVILLVYLTVIGSVLVQGDPQLDIPGIQHSTEAPPQKGLRVVVLPNSYANNGANDDQPKSEANTHFDSDRSQRYGTEN